LLLGFTAGVANCGGECVDLSPRKEPSLAGTWTTTVSSSAFVSSPKTLHLELDDRGNGTLLVGDAALPPPIDPTLGSPPEAEADAGASTALLLHLYDGVQYALVPSNVTQRGLFFYVDAVEAFAPLCAIEPSTSTDLGYRCLPDWEGGVDPSENPNPETSSAVAVFFTREGN
jgi:hypothetical protein